MELKASKNLLLSISFWLEETLLATLQKQLLLNTLPYFTFEFCGTMKDQLMTNLLHFLKQFIAFMARLKVNTSSLDDFKMRDTITYSIKNYSKGILHVS